MIIMSDPIKHECGIALIRLLKPLEYYSEKYGSSMFGINKMCLLMEKQYNRGQDGAGVACIKYNMEPGNKYLSRLRSASSTPIKDIFEEISKETEEYSKKDPDIFKNPQKMKEKMRFCGELFLGHLRYGTHGKNDINNCHPVMRENNWPSKSLLLAGNFNLTNVDELFEILVEIGQHPEGKRDTITILEKIGHFLDEENEELVGKYKKEGYSKKEISGLIANNIDIQKVLIPACKKWDGGYTIAGLIGHGDAFVLRDPSGIRPAYYYKDDEVVIVTSERAPIQTAMNVSRDQIKEIEAGHALIIKKDGKISEVPFTAKKQRASCSFERIYFSRGSDYDIYKERKMLGRLITPQILKQINYDIENTVFSFIPNTAEVCFYGMQQELNSYCDKIKKEKILALKEKIDRARLERIFNFYPRYEKIAVKDGKLRTFITQDITRDSMVAHVYDITYGTVRKGIDTLVAIDDSIVRGTTLKQSILKILDRLGAKKIVIVSSAPQIRYPDCYGIDMAKIGDFIAFRAAIELLKDTNQNHVIDETYKKAKKQEFLPKEEIINYVKDIYKPFSVEQISDKISELASPPDISTEVKFVFQKIGNLHKACPEHPGDWYFTGNYPTPGGNKVVNKAFINYIEGKNERAY
jgi:amidophosphoribosyltransferase